LGQIKKVKSMPKTRKLTVGLKVIKLVARRRVVNEGLQVTN